MRYICVKWIHDYQDEPVIIYGEVDDEGWELRKVELYRDDSVGYSYDNKEVKSMGLSIVPIPPIEEIAAAGPEFEPTEISKDEFEQIWREKVLKEE